MNRRIVPFSLVLAGSLLAYACSSSDSGSSSGNTDPDASSSGSSGTSGTSGTSGGEGEGGTDGSSGNDGSSSGGANPIEGIGAPAAVSVAGQAFTGTDIEGPIFQNGSLYFNAGGAPGALVDFVPTVNTFALNTYAQPQGFGMTYDKKSAKVIIAAADTATPTGGGQILAFAPIAPPAANATPSVTPTALTLNWGDSGATGFDSPTDVVAKSDGTLYVTDGAFKATDTSQVLHNKVWRLKPTATAGSYDVFKTEIDGQPNGIALSTDEKTLYVLVSNLGLNTGMSNIVKYPVGMDGALGASAPFANVNGTAPGSTTKATALAIDSAGNIYASYFTGVDVFKPDATKWGTIAAPTGAMGVANLAFGGADLKTLYIGGFNDLYTVTVKVAGVAQ